MTLQFKYNKSEWHELSKQVKIRQQALPTLKSKEAALRVEVKKYKKLKVQFEQELFKQKKTMKSMIRLWAEFEPGLVKIKQLHYTHKSIAGVAFPYLDDLEFEIKDISLYQKPDWFLDGIQLLESITRVTLLMESNRKATEILDYARKKTTQKVNLYEKVQIPAFQDAMRKIKRYLEDEENLSKSAQKILKRKKETR
jgi:V/A-type H+-transporting ATPase subunit D